MVTHLKDLHIALRLYHANLMNLHWNAKGEDFNDSHKSITSEYYDLCYKYIDITAEMLARLNITCPNYIEAAKWMQESEAKYFVVDSNRLYTRAQIIQLADYMFKGILNLIEYTLAEDLMKDPRNTGIKSDLESMHSEFDLQSRYINARRMEQ